jgi:plasmid stabilization system protein ParE
VAVRIYLNRLARNDLRSIYSHGVEQSGEEQADRHFQALLDGSARLEEYREALALVNVTGVSYQRAVLQGQASTNA